MPGPEQQARERIDAMLQEAGWAVCASPSNEPASVLLERITATAIPKKNTRRRMRTI